MDRGAQPAQGVKPEQYRFRKSLEDLPKYERRVIVAGSRKWDDYAFFAKGMHEYVRANFAPNEQLVFITGFADSGADALIVRWCEECGYPWVPVAADWDDLEAPGAVVRYTRAGKPYNVRAGYQRNAKMAELGTNLIAWWDGVSGGTRDMIAQAHKRRLTVFTVIFDTLAQKVDYGRQSQSRGSGNH